MFNHGTLEALLMRWLKSDRWKAGIGIAGMLLLLVFMVWVPVSAAGAYEVTPGLATPTTGTVQATPKVDPTMIALQEAQLKQQIIQLQLQNDRSISAWIWSSIATLGTVVAALLAVVGVSLSIGATLNKDRTARQDAQDKDRTARQDAQDKDRKDRQDERAKQAEERFQKVVDGLGSDKEQLRIGAAIILHTFVQPDYQQFYKQAFELAVANLRLQQPLVTFDQPPSSLNQALAVILRDVYSVLYKSLQEKYKVKDYLSWDIITQALDAGYVKLDKTILYDVHWEQIYMPQVYLQYAILQSAHLTGAYLQNAHLMNTDFSAADLTNADLTNADLTNANLTFADFSGATLLGAHLNGAILDGASFKKTDSSVVDLSGADLTNAKLRVALYENTPNNVDLTEANLSGATLSGADLSGADLTKANLTGANLGGTNPEDARSLEGTDLRGVKGLKKEQIDACKAKHAIVDEASTTNSSQSTVPPSSPSPSNDVHSPSTPSAQGNTPTSDTGGSSATPSSKPGPES
jgi:uncharacterized protein YjbI with pentapeptide repeats